MKAAALIRRAIENGTRASLVPTPSIVDAARAAAAFPGRRSRVLSDDRKDKRWRTVRDGILRPFLPPSLRLLGKLLTANRLGRPETPEEKANRKERARRRRMGT